MSHDDRAERTVRMLTQRLDDLARALERSGAPADGVARLLELASVATMHAVALELITSERAAEIWTTAVKRHPSLRMVAPLQATRTDRLAA